MRRLSHGRVCFNWYRIAVTIPERVGDLDPTGSTVVFEVAIDDYAEVWVNGELPLALGDTGGPVVGGFNAPNRVVLSRDARPGQRFQIAVFGINGPISASPHNYIWMRTATLDFYARRARRAAWEAPVEVERSAPADRRDRPRGPALEQVAGGFEFTEGPVWSPDGALLFSSPNTNVIYRWAPTGKVTVFRSKSGYTGIDIGRYDQPGSNGLTFDPGGAADDLPARQPPRDPRQPARRHHRARRRVRGEAAEQPQRPRLPLGRDAVLHRPAVRAAGGVRRPGQGARLQRRLRGQDGEMLLIDDELEGPNGLAFSPDERYLYVGNWDPERKVVMRYEIDESGAASSGEVFYDMTGAPARTRSTGSRSTRPATSTPAAPAASGCCPPRASSSACSSCPRTRTTSRGATRTVARSTSPH